MKPFFNSVFLESVRRMEWFITLKREEEWEELQLSGEIREKAKSCWGVSAEVCAVYGLTASKVTAEKIGRLLSTGDDCSAEKLRLLMVELQERIIDELSAPRFFALTDEEAVYHNNPRKGWEAIVERFPSSVFDVEEAGKCYALGRYTAGVLHLNRVLEVGMDALKIETGITSYSPTWKVALDQINKTTTIKPEKDKTSEERTRDGFIRDAVYFLSTAKDAIRNPSTHKAERTYTGEAALEVYVAVRAFMRHLGTKLSEAVE